MDYQYGLPLRVEEVKAVGDTWEVSGYVSTFGNTDFGFDVVMPGAFARTLKENPEVPLLLHHDQGRPVGRSIELHEDSKGLFGRFHLTKAPDGQAAHTMLKDKTLKAFSMGYRARDVDFADNGDVRKLLDVDLYEGSLVAMPMNPLAAVTSVKSVLETLPFAARWQAINEYLSYGVAEAEALLARRVADQRGFGQAHIDALQAAVPEAEAYVDGLKALLQSAADVKAERGRDYRLTIARRRLAKLARSGDTRP